MSYEVLHAHTAGKARRSLHGRGSSSFQNRTRVGGVELSRGSYKFRRNLQRPRFRDAYLQRSPFVYSLFPMTRVKEERSVA